ncbi:type II secretion system F family protein [Streptomyces smyrnaeus]|uniref:Type II secretion system F family protein n=1 Tax=Streptomyces smyrnaeus TaxID=1387713 RepID=A0ABS3XRZ3_9ACTN|nr:type II secretion system F family protein [Streptomyces smyrnaeus]
MWGPTVTAVLATAWCVRGVVEVVQREKAVRRRAHLLCGPARDAARGSVVAGEPPGRGRRWAAGRKWEAALGARRVREGAGVAGAGVLGVLLIGGPVGWVMGGAAAWGTWRWLRRQADAEDTRSAAERAAEAQLPLAAELMAACLAAGAGPERAAEAVGGSLGGPLGDRLARAATELRLGAEPALVWGRFAERPWGVQFARCMERAGVAGVPAVESVTRLAAELRGSRARAAGSRARRAAVLVTGPLGLCFLPAFLTVGVVPVLLGLARSLW